MANTPCRLLELEIMRISCLRSYYGLKVRFHSPSLREYPVSHSEAFMRPPKQLHDLEFSAPSFSLLSSPKVAEPHTETQLTDSAPPACTNVTPAAHSSKATKATQATHHAMAHRLDAAP
jgi:hypothetical protein